MSLNPAVSEIATCLDFDRVESASTQGAATRGAARATIDSRTLLREGRELVILHGEHEYRLRLTQNDKLILTK
ncbi:hemin uptake protein HemP [Aquimonas voraii]|uniref:Hemin uptake protein HemP n=1 Tax=Aquimonas voraii TaxID=265719 RepID=A0A1G6UQ55_9GAMM|nr:hemin uptake protein HemP [Aquimonas voraii]SDD43413.1 Hemin uptake protein HemP [Aquimonas voraii]